MNDVEGAVLILRLAVGVILFAHGLHKFEEWSELNTIWREDYGLPLGSVTLAGVLQIASGLALILGIFTRYAAAVLVAVMLVATWVSLWKHREPFRSTPHGKGWDVNLLLIAALVALVLLGGGRWSLAGWLV